MGAELETPNFDERMNDEARMTNDERMTKRESRIHMARSVFGLHSSFVIRHSSLFP
jgi:hypothetical protein